ncbi:MAG TPA: response regulator [Methanosarcinales archaeon]|nr:response regulator [Methanosarcinales archaeon]
MKDKILIVDDEENMLDFLSNILAREYEVETAINGNYAKEKLKKEKIDMVIADLRMPIMNGKELIKYIHKEVDPDIINIIITGHSEDWSYVDATDQHVFHYFNKGEFEPKDLKKVVKNGLELRKLRLKEKAYQKRLEKEVEDRTKELKKTYEALEQKKALLEYQYQIKSMLTSVIPLLLYGAPPASKNRFIMEMCNQIEKILYNKYISELKEIDMNTLAAILCQIMNDLGGEFEVYRVTDKIGVVKGNKCPWGKEAQKNPVLCMHCNCIFSRIATKVFDKVIVSLEKTIGNKDDYCIISMKRF